MLFSLFIIMIEMLCFIIFMNTFLDATGCSLKRTVVFYSILVLLGFLSGMFFQKYENLFIVKQIVILLFLSIASYFYYMGTKLKCFIFVGLYDAVLLVADWLTYIIILSIFDNANIWDIGNGSVGNLFVLLGKLLLFACVLIIKKVFDRESVGKLSNIQWVQISSFTVFSLIISYAFFYEYKMDGNPNQLMFFYILEIGLIVMNLCEFFLIESTAKRERVIYETQLLEIQYENKLKEFKVIEAGYDTQKKRAHDFNNKINCITTLIQEQKYDELQKYIEELEQENKTGGRVLATNNVIVDAIVNNKYGVMVDKDILFIPKMIDADNLNIKSDDIVILLSNLLDNAIEAAAKCKEKKTISLIIKSDNDNTLIAVKNSYCEPINESNGIIETSKKGEAENHGYGIKNIISVVEKYDGEYAISHENGEFLFSIMLPSENKY